MIKKAAFVEISEPAERAGGGYACPLFCEVMISRLRHLNLTFVVHATSHLP